MTSFRDREFERLIASGEFVEHADVFGNLYGTRKSVIEAALREGRDLILEIDWQGARQVRAQLPQAVQVFILPPSRAELEARLRKRATDAGRPSRAGLPSRSRWRTGRISTTWSLTATSTRRSPRSKRSLTAAGNPAGSHRPGLKALVKELLGT